jgi:hypothetical protein
VKYAANLLFEWRLPGRTPRGSRCEERIVVFRAPTDRKAVPAAKKIGRAGQMSYLNADRKRLRVQFIGIRDLMSLGKECDPGEVWYRFFHPKSPRRLVREDRRLAVFNPARTMRSVWWAVPLFLVSKRKARRPKGKARA